MFFVLRQEGRKAAWWVRLCAAAAATASAAVSLPTRDYARGLTAKEAREGGVRVMSVG